MRFSPKDPPRVFQVGRPENPIHLKDCGNIELEPDEQVTFLTESGAEYDVARKSWGYYATPSLNGRLRSHGFKTALVQNRLTKRYFVMLVEMNRLAEFQSYLETEKQRLVEWLDERPTP